MTEAELTSRFLKWAKVNLRETFVFEAKICKDKSLPFSRLEEHQERALLVASEGCLSHKIIDAGSQNPFDGFQSCGVPAYVVVFWWQQRGDRRMTLIRIEDWIAERERSERKSLTFERASEIGIAREMI